MAGFLIGATSTLFKTFQLQHREMKKDVDEWKYLSLVTDNASTYDFKFSQRVDAVDLIVAVSESVAPINPRYVGLTNHRLINILLIKAKLVKIAT